jgi:excisionase family DNA binding protein
MTRTNVAAPVVGGGARYLTAAEVASFCGGTYKSVHNWAKERGLPHFFTPGRHIRFKAREVAPWLREHGYDIPAELIVLEREDNARVSAEKAAAAGSEAA